MKNKAINIIGAGLAGSEAAFYLAQLGFKINLFEVKRVKSNPVQVSKNFAELVCSNSLRSNELTNAVGTLKQEMRMLNSLIMMAAQSCQVPAGGSLAVDREQFSAYITKELESHENITIYNEEIYDLTSFSKDEIILITSGPLTSPLLQESISKMVGNDDFYFFDAVAPIVTKDSIDMNIAFRKNRYEKGETLDYINCPMNKEQYDLFYQELIDGEITIGHLEGESELKYFEGCMPVEAMAKRGEKTLLFGPLKPQGLRNLDGSKNYAVVQLRQDDATDGLYNLVGFQTNLKWSEQKRIFSLIPGLENAEFIRYGVMHKNNFINSPKVLNEYFQLKTNPNIFFAGQITGVEGYVESSASGLMVGINIGRFLCDKEMTLPTSDTVLGALFNYVHKSSTTNFQPMKANWGIVDELAFDNKNRDKTIKKTSLSLRAINSMQDFIEKQ